MNDLQLIDAVKTGQLAKVEEALNAGADIHQQDDLDYAWQYVNHSCEPNGYVNAAEYSFSALRNIRKGDEITFNYLTTEYELAAPFQCECGSAKCFGSIRGYKFLTADQLAELLPVTSMTTSSK